MTRSILSYVEIFTDRRKLPRIEMELILRGSEICFSPSISEVSEMILSVVFEVSNMFSYNFMQLYMVVHIFMFIEFEMRNVAI